MSDDDGFPRSTPIRVRAPHAGNQAKATPSVIRQQITAGVARRGRSLTTGHATRERLAKGDIVQAGDRHVAEDILLRLHRRGHMDRDPVKARLMLEAGQRFQNDSHVAALDGFAAIDLTGAGGTRSGTKIPISQAAACARDRLFLAKSCMPRDAATALHDLLVAGLDAQTVGANLSSYKGSGERAAVALTLLRVGLLALVENG